MSDSIYEPGADIDTDQAADLDQEFGEDDVDGMYDTSYSPPDHEPVNTRFGTTLAEEREGETLDQRIAQEEPDPSSRYEGERDVDEVDEDELEPEDLRYTEVGGDRAGRLVDPDEGAHEDAEKDLIGSDVGIDAGAASAEEAAVHVIDE